MWSWKRTRQRMRSCFEGDLDFSQVKTVNLDEYRGLAPDREQSYHYFMDRHLFSKVNINRSHIHIPDGMNEDWQEECGRYEQMIEELGGIDLQILGLGHNGHIGFNEPDSQFAPLTRRVDLTESTIEDVTVIADREALGKL